MNLFRIQFYVSCLCSIFLSCFLSLFNDVPEGYLGMVIPLLSLSFLFEFYGILRAVVQTCETLLTLIIPGGMTFHKGHIVDRAYFLAETA